MILKNTLSVLILCIGVINDASGASFSNVYVESEIPVRHYRYDTSFNYAPVVGPELSQINTLPASIPGYIAPCVSPCIVSGLGVAAAETSPSVLAQNTQPYATVPVVVAPSKQDATGYEYSYAVYDENTGDHKAQRELSDGSVIRGEYSFLQPDGYVREVQYVADDLKGFNAVVRKFLPVTVDGKEKFPKERKDYSPVWPETKLASLKTELSEELEKHVNVHSRIPKRQASADHDEPQEKGKKSIKESIKLEEIKETPYQKSRKYSKQSIETQSPKTNDKTQSTEELQEELRVEKPIRDPLKGTHELTTSEHETLVAYHDIIRCIETVLKRTNGKTADLKTEPSPLTYIVFNKPC